MSSSKLKILVFAAALGAVAVTPLFAADTKTISAVEIQERDGVTRVLLRGAEDPIYTAFMRTDPPRLIVEMPDVVFSGVESPIAADTSLVSDVELGAFGDPRVDLSMARVTLGLKGESDYELLPKGDELWIEVRPNGAASLTTAQQGANAPSAVAPSANAPSANAPSANAPSANAPADETPPAAADKAAPKGSSAKSDAPATAETPSAPKAQANDATAKLERVTRTADGAQVWASGPADNVDSFMLDDPPRLVLDFWGVRNAIAPKSQKVEWGPITNVRVGEHPDKVRVVFDMTAAPASHEVESSDTGSRLRLVAVAADETAPAATEPADAMAEKSAAQDAASEVVEALRASQGDDEEAVLAKEAEAAKETGASVSYEWQPTEAASESMPAAPEQPMVTGDARVQSVHFESLPETDRVVVTLDGTPKTEMVSPDGDTLIVMLKDSKIEGASERRVDTSDFNGPVQHFSVFQTPDVAYDEVRVVLKRRAGVKGQLSWQGSQLHIELPRDAAAQWTAPEGGDSSAAPAPPAMPSAAANEVERATAAMDAAAPAPAMASAADDMGDAFMDGGPADPAAIDILDEGGFSEEKAYTGRRISLDFKDADIGNILRLIAEVSDLNVIAGEEVEGEVTIRLVDVPWDQALDVVLLTKGLGFVRVGNVLRIAPLETLKLEAEARLQDRRAKEKLEDLVVKLQPVNYADVKDVRDLVKKLLSKRGTVNMDKRTNTLIIKDIPSVVQEATALAKAIDTATPQVLIESKIVEASLSFSRALGAAWGLGYNANGSSGGGQDLHLADGGLDDLLGLPGDQGSNFIAANPIFDANNGFLQLGLLGLDDHLQLDLAIEAAESNNKGKVISSPRVVTLDNREATIKQGVAIKFEAATRDKITISFIDAVLELKVKPHITANRSIIMKLKVSRNAPSISAATGDIVGIDKNEAETETLVRDGETLVLGGIYVVDSGKSVTKTPFLADIPLLGTAFQSNVNQDERRELLIFVTPRIIMGTPDTAGL